MNDAKDVRANKRINTELEAGPKKKEWRKKEDEQESKIIIVKILFLF